MPTLKQVVLAKKPTPAKGECLLIVNGLPCQRPVFYRGLCNAHISFLRTRRLLDQYALPAKKLTDKRYDLRPNPNAAEGLCAVIENDVPCASVVGQRGLCRRHYANIWQRPDLNLEDFAKDKPAIQYSRAKTGTSGCVVREHIGKEFKVCGLPRHARGMCRAHYRRLQGTPALFNRIADPLQPKSARYQLKRQFTDGICVVVENGVGCNYPTQHPRRVCLTHLRQLTRIRKLRALTDAFMVKPYVITKRAPELIVPGFCILVVDGKHCANPVKRRGLCGACIHRITQRKLNFDEYALPIQAKRRTRGEIVRRPRLTKSLCMAVVNGEPCQGFPCERGLCHIHSNLAKRLKKLDQIALSDAELKDLPDLPQFYLDKNIVIRFAMFENFGVRPEVSSIKLVEKVLMGQATGTVSLDCIRAVYSHLGHRLARPKDQGGKDLDEKAAESQSRKYTGHLFFGRGGLWRFMEFTASDLRHCTVHNQFPELSLEDALEMRLYARAKNECARMLFITADGGILNQTEAVHPAQALQALA